jgi:DNA-binding MarR family transcriptional regulator
MGRERADHRTSGAVLAELLFVTAHNLRQQAVRELLDERVTYERLRLLRFLNDDGDLTMTEMSRRLGVTPRAVTTLAACVESAGLLTRRPNVRDGRSVVLAITEDGRRVVDELGEAQRAASAAVFDRLTRDQRIALREILDVLNAAE